jgi:predicted HicB family RNase H-like nuclease
VAAEPDEAKTAVITLRVTPRLKAIAEVAARREHRSLTSLIEVLILNHCERAEIAVPGTQPRDRGQ